MNPIELVIWSMALGAIASVAAARALDAIMRPSRSRWRGTLYHAGVFVFVLVMCGVLSHLLDPERRLFHVTQVLIGPTSVGLSNLWIQRWLSARRRDRLMSAALRASALVLPLAAFAALALPMHLQLPAAAAVALLGGTLTLWMTLRAWLLGDRLALVMALGCLLTLPAIAGMYAVAMDTEFDALLHAFAAICAAGSNALTGIALWRREVQEWAASQWGAGRPDVDPVTRLPGGAGVVRGLLEAQRRRQRTRRDGAVLAVVVFDPHRISSLVGEAGLNELYIAIAGRLQRQLGVVNTVGRYWDRCFIAMVETIHSPGWLRTTGLRVAASLRKPFEVSDRDGRRTEVRADIGVGVLRLPPADLPVEDILHDVQLAAEAARAMPSRASTIGNNGPVAVEEADLRPPRRRPRGGRVAAVAAE